AEPLALSLHDALPISGLSGGGSLLHDASGAAGRGQVVLHRGLACLEKSHTVQRQLTIVPGGPATVGQAGDKPVNVTLGDNRLGRSEEHTSELQSRENH